MNAVIEKDEKTEKRLAKEKAEAAATERKKERERIAIPDQELDVFMSIVRNMARFLGPRNDRDQVKHSWELATERAARGESLLPSPEVIDALLLGEDSLLFKHVDPETGVPGNDSDLVYQWRYRYADLVLTTPPKSSNVPGAAKAPLDTSAQVQAGIIKIELVGERLADLLEIPPNSPTHVFDLLGDHWRVLATTPAWQQVRASIENIRLVEKGTGSTASFDKDCDNVLKFDSLLRRAEPVLLMLFWCAAVLRGLGLSQKPPLSLYFAFELLCDGLGFAHIDTAGVDQRTVTFTSGVSELLKLDAKAFLEPGVPHLAPMLADESLEAALGEVTIKASTSALQWQSLRNAAWDKFYARLLARNDGELLPASREEILCVVRSIGPAAVLGLDFTRASLSTWSRALLDVAGFSAGSAASAESIPPAIAVFALRQLGADALSPSTIDDLLKLVAGEGHGSETFDQLRALARKLKLGVGSGRRAAIVVRNPFSSLTERWVDTPLQGLVIVVYPGDVVDGRLVELLRVVTRDRPLPFIWEEPASSPGEQVQVSSSIRSRTKVSIHEGYMYETEEPSMKSPAIVDPYSPDAVFSTLRS